MSWVHVKVALAVPRQTKVKGRGLSVYALLDPSDMCIRYIGVTSRELQDRLRFHLEKPTNGRMATWFSSLRAHGSRPVIILLERVRIAEWEAAERGWIYWAREHGELLNVDRGGIARTRTGALRGFKAGAYQPPASVLPQKRAMRLADKILLNVPKAPGGGREGRESEPRRRPRLVPVSSGVFRRA